MTAEVWSSYPSDFELKLLSKKNECAAFTLDY
jgi:hypothetical protein